MTTAVVWFAVGGLLVGGAIAFAQQKKPAWTSILLVITAALCVWWGVVNVQAA